MILYIIIGVLAVGFLITLIYAIFLRSKEKKNIEQMIAKCFDYAVWKYNAEIELDKQTAEFAESRIDLLLATYKEQYAEKLKQFTPFVLESDDFKLFSMTCSYLKKQLLKMFTASVKFDTDIDLSVTGMIEQALKTLNMSYVKHERVTSLMVLEIFEANKIALRDYLGQSFLFYQTSKLKIRQEKEKRELDFNSFVRGQNG